MKAIIFSLLCFTSLFSHADLSDDIEGVIYNNLKFTMDENIPGVMSTIHSQSPAFLASQNMMEQLFSAYEISFTIHNIKVIGSDGDYAYARVTQSSKKVSGPAFQDNTLDMLQVFKKEDDQWKLWTQANLDIKFD
ncbi:MAG: nuclear transport factor 2 family protein [Gammaproteobacteria bacterium]|nr:nuclear transport factor 2 family protein [Gammaproteobacteria bacterium]